MIRVTSPGGLIVFDIQNIDINLSQKIIKNKNINGYLSDSKQKYLKK